MTTTTQDPGKHDEDNGKGKGHEKEIHFTIDGDRYVSNHNKVTPRELLVSFAKVDAEQVYLVELEGSHQHSFKDELDKQITLHEKVEFITVSLGPTPVS